jgi:hypothetical protein
MAIKMATWLHGNGAVAEFPPMAKRNMAGSAIFQGADLSTNFFHFPITTPVIIDGVRPKVVRVFVLHTLRFSEVREVELRSGLFRAARFTPASEPLAVRQRPEVNRSDFVLNKSMFEFAPLDTPKQIDQGLGITLKVFFDSTESLQQADGSFIDRHRNIGTIEFFSVGVDWE